MSTSRPGRTPSDKNSGVPRTRLAGLWIASVLFAAVLLLLLVFILQNTQRAEISFFGARANPPVGVALLLAAVFGVLLVALPGTARILQLRVLAKRRGEIARAVEAPEPEPDYPEARANYPEPRPAPDVVPHPATDDEGRPTGR